MEWNQVIIIILIGAVAGLLAGLLGLGGAILIIPALVMLLGYSQQMAQGTTLLMLIPPVGALAAWQYYKAGQADWKTAALLAVSFFISGYFGARMANHISPQWLRKMFAALLIILALKMFFTEK